MTVNFSNFFLTVRFRRFLHFVLLLPIFYGTIVFADAPLPEKNVDATPSGSRNPDRSNSPAQPSWARYFEEESVAWRLLHSENGGGILTQQRTSERVQQGERSEMIRMRLPRNACLVLGHSLDFPLAIEDLTPSLWVRSDQSGLVIGAQVVLPNALHPETGEPVTFLVAGSRYGGSGQWERLGFWNRNGIPNLSREAERIVGLLRAEWKTNFDSRDKYIRRIILLAEPDPNETTPKTVWIDSLEVYGHVAARREYLDRFEGKGDPHSSFDPVNFGGFKIQAGSGCVFQPYSVKGAHGYTEWESQMTNRKAEPLIATPMGGTASLLTQPRKRERSLFSGEAEVHYSLTNRQEPELAFSPASSLPIRLSEQTLLVNEVPIGVRAIEYQGEPLAFLRQLEFNAVWIKGQASPELLREARDAGVWLIPMAPESSELEAAKRFDAASSRDRSGFLTTPLIDAQYDNVLAWNLGDECANPNHSVDAQRATSLQNADRARRRPILCTARSGVREYSRIVNVLMMDRTPLLSSLDLVDLAQWQNSYPTLARYDTPFWSTIQTDPDPRLAGQWILFGANAQDLCPITHEQIKMQVYQALAVGVHGLIFTSNTPLTNNDPATEFRRTSLELINWELQMLEEWFAAGSSRPAPIKTSKLGKMSSALLQSGRTRLLVPIWQERQSQMAVGGAVDGPFKYILSGIPETYGAYLLVPGRLFPIETTRVAGGLEIELEEANLNSLVYFGEIDATYARIEERAKTIGRRAAYLACRLAELQLASTEQVLSVLKQAKEAGAVPSHLEDNMPLISMQEYESLLRSTKEEVERARSMIDSKPPAYATAYTHAEKATRGLRVTARELLRSATRHDLHPCMTPVSVCFATLPFYLNTYQRMIGARLGPNRLPAGDMENVNLWKNSGWDSRLHRIEGVAPPVLQISPQAKHGGQHGLLIRVQPTSLEEKPVQLETSPIWVISPSSVQVRMGELICVNGWVRIPKPLDSCVDGFMVFDSLGGEALALRFTETKGAWKEFAFYRYAPADGNYSVFFSLHGFGEVHLDDVQIAAVQLEEPKPPLPAAQPTPPSTWQRLNPLQYLPPLPNWGGNQ